MFRHHPDRFRQQTGNRPPMSAGDVRISAGSDANHHDHDVISIQNEISIRRLNRTIPAVK
jgi:hypothetical protein